MKILILENQPSSKLGGQELSLLDVCQGLAKRGHKIHLLFLRDGDLLERYREFAVGLTRVGRYTIDRKRTLASGIEWLGSIKNALRLRPDVVYANQYHDTLFGGIVASLKRRPFVCHLRLAPPRPVCGQFRIGLSLVDRFIANTREVRDLYVTNGLNEELFDVVYNGIDLDRFNPRPDGRALRSTFRIPADSRVIFYAGRLDPEKGIDILLRAFSRLPKTVWLWIAGSPVVHPTESAADMYLTGLKRLALELGVGERVFWLGRRADVADLCRASDVVVLPSVVVESFGRILVEGMACGVPALGPRRGGVPEVLSGEYQRFLFRPGDDSDLADRLLTVIDWRTAEPDLGLRCRRHVEERFSLDRMVNGVEAALERSTAKPLAGGELPQ